VFATASYPNYLAIEHSADEKYLAWVREHAADRLQFEAEMRRVLGDRPSTGYFHRLSWHGPALDNKTPRAAASDPALRPQLLLWMKFWISQTDRRNLETGRNDDTNWMVRELGLTEILFEPPPPRPRLPRAPGMANEEEDGDILPRYCFLPDPPALPDRPWTKPEATMLFDRASRTFSPVTEFGELLPRPAISALC